MRALLRGLRMTVLPALLAASLVPVPAGAAPAPSDPAHVEARALTQLMGGAEAAGRVLASMRGLMIRVLMASGHATEAKAAEVVDQILLPAMKAHAGELVDARAEIYAEHFSVDELKQIEAFYHSAVGQKMLLLTPEIMKEGTAIGAAWGQRIARQAIEQHMQEIRARGVQL